MKNLGAYPETPQIVLVPPIISGTGKATDFKFSQYIQRVHPKKAREKFWKKGSVGVSKDCPFFRVPPIISGTGKATDFKFCMHIYGLNRHKSPLKIPEKYR